MSKNTRKNKSKKDTISEQEFTIEMDGSSTLPEVDSPSGSDTDEETEFLVGLNHEPKENKSQRTPIADSEADLSS